MPQPPQIVEFVDPLDWGRKLQKNEKNKKRAKLETREEQDSKRIMFDFETAKREVIELGASGLTPKERKKLKEQRLIEMGFPPVKKKIPLKILFGSHKKRKEREKKEKQARMDAGGVVVHSSAAYTSAQASGMSLSSSSSKEKKRGHRRFQPDTGIMKIRNVASSR